MSSAARSAHRTQLFGQFGLVHEIVQEGLVHGGAEPNGTDGSAAPQDAAWSDDCLYNRPNEHRKGKAAKAITQRAVRRFSHFYACHVCVHYPYTPVKSEFRHFIFHDSVSLMTFSHWV